MNNRKSPVVKPVIFDLPQYKVSRNMLKLTKNGQMLLVNTLEIKPLLITRGKELVEAALAAVGTATPHPPGDEQLYEMLRDYRIITRRSDPEKPPLGDYRYNPEEKKMGMTMYLLVSQECNLRCKYCFADEFPYRQKKQMPFEVAAQAIRRNAERLREDGKISLVFFGGEPLMNWPLIKQVIHFVETEIKPRYPKRQFPFHITTNLTHLPEDFVPWVKEHGLTLLTDVDGHRAQEHDSLRPTVEGKGSFEDILKNIHALAQAGIRVEVRSTICASNQGQIFEIAKYMRELSGVGSVLELLTPFDCSQNPVPEELLPDVDQYIRDVERIYASGSPPVENIFPINKYLEKLREGKGAALGCGMPWGNINIVDYQGDVYMCTFLVGQERYKLGNVFDPGLTYANEARAVEQAFKSVHVDHVPSCQRCSWKYICTGHCPIARLAIEANEERGRKMPAYVKKYAFAKSCKMSRFFYERLLWDLASNTLPVPPEEPSSKPVESSCCA